MSQYKALEQAGFVLPGGAPLQSLPDTSRQMAPRIPRQMANTYDAMAYGRRLGGWMASLLGPNALVYAGLNTIRARVRELLRNNPWLAGSLDTYASNVIGRGITPRWTGIDDTLKSQIEDLWRQWVCESDSEAVLDFYGLQTIVAKTLFQSGECLIRKKLVPINSVETIPLKLQVLEPDYISQINDGVSAYGGNLIRMGIEFGANDGMRKAYWLYKAHPGDSALWFSNAMSTVRVPVDQIIHTYKIDRPGQIRGTPALASIVAKMFFLDAYEDAELDRKKTAAMFAAFVTMNRPENPVAVGFDALTNQDQNGNAFAQLEPGILQYLLPGEDIKFAAPADVGPNYENWIVMQLRAIAAGIGLTYEQLTGDYSKVNYSSLRGGAIEFRRKVSMTQNNIIIFQVCRKVARWFMDTAVACGKLDIPDYTDNPGKYLNIIWQPEGWAWVDPQKDIMAAKEAIKAGLSSRESVAAEEGTSIDELDAQLQRNQESSDSRGLKFDIDMRGAGQPVIVGSNKASTKTSNSNPPMSTPVPQTPGTGTDKGSAEPASDEEPSENIN